MASASAETLGALSEKSHDPEVLKSQDGPPEKHQAPAVDQYEVVIEPEDDPKNIPLLRKWLAVLTIATATLCATSASTMAAFTEDGVAADFGVSLEVTILGVSMFVLGLGLAPLLAGPLSELYGRTIIYRTSFFLFWVFSFPVAFAPNIGVYLFFRFVTGFCCAPIFSVSGGTVSDMFLNSHLGPPMSINSTAPFIGPVLGPLIAGFINQHVSWRWTYRVMIVWSFVEFVGLWVLVPETYVPLLLKRKAQRLRKSTGDENYWAPLERLNRGPVRNILDSSVKSLHIIYYERMALLLDLWTAFILGTLYLTFQVYPIIFGDVHGFSLQMQGLTFLGIGIGMMIALFSQPLWDRLNAKMMIKHNGNPPPEARLIMGQWGGILMPIGLFWIAFTTYKRVHWILPIIGSIPLGAAISFSFSSTLTYLVVAYRPVAASAMAGNSFLRCTFACAFPLFAGYMYNKLGTVGATAFLAGIAALMAPLPFIFYRIGARLRQNSRFATKE